MELTVIGIDAGKGEGPRKVLIAHVYRSVPETIGTIGYRTARGGVNSGYPMPLDGISGIDGGTRRAKGQGVRRPYVDGGSCGERGAHPGEQDDAENSTQTVTRGHGGTSRM